MGLEDEDAGLVARVADADHDAFAALVDRHALRCVALAERLLHDRQEAEDMVQEAFTTLWIKPGRFDPARAKFSTWFYRVVINRCLDQRRKKMPDALPENYDARDPSPDAEAHMVGQHRDRQMRSAIDKLPDRQRTAIILCYLQGQSNAQAAEIMDIKIKALESLLVRARGKLKQFLGPVKHELMEGEPL